MRNKNDAENSNGVVLWIRWRLEDRGFPSFVAMASSSHRHDHRRNELRAEASWKKWRENTAAKNQREKNQNNIQLIHMKNQKER